MASTLPEGQIVIDAPVASPPAANVSVASARGTIDRLFASYPGFLELVAYDLTAFLQQDEAVRLWRTVVYVTSPTADLDILLPVMLAGGLDYFGTHRDAKRFVQIEDRSRAVRFIRGEKPTPDAQGRVSEPRPWTR